MRRDHQQLIALLQRVFLLTRGKLSLPLMLLIAGALALYALVIQPVAQDRLGVSLPSILGDAPEQPSSPPATVPENDREASRSGPSTNTPNAQQSGADGFNPAELQEVLTPEGRRDAYRSTAGLRYTRGSEHGHRVAHVLAHMQDEPNQPGQHGVYNSADPVTVLKLVDEAYLQAKRGEKTKERIEGDRTIWTVNMGRSIGWIGGESGNRKGNPTARHLRLVVEGDRLITAYPYRP